MVLICWLRNLTFWVKFYQEIPKKKYTVSNFVYVDKDSIFIYFYLCLVSKYALKTTYICSFFPVDFKKFTWSEAQERVYVCHYPVDMLIKSNLFLALESKVHIVIFSVDSLIIHTGQTFSLNLAQEPYICSFFPVDLLILRNLLSHWPRKDYMYVIILLICW